MEDQREAVKEALTIYRRRKQLDEFGLEDAVNTLAKRHLWSLHQIVKITGASKFFVTQRVAKSDTTGGKFNPASLELILEAIDLKQLGQVNRPLLKRIVDDGTSANMLSRLTGMPVSTIRWNLDQLAADA